MAGALLAAALFSACGPESGELSPSSEEDEAGSGGKADGIFPFDRAPRPGTGGPSRASAAKILERALAPGESLQNVNVLWDPSAGALLEGVALAANRASYRYLSLGQQGTKRTYASWRSAADAARFARFGKLHPDVFQAASAGSTVEVLVIAVEPEGLSSRIPPNTSADKVKPFVAGNNRRIKMLWAPRLKAVSAWLTGRRAVVTAQAEQLGAVQAKVPSAVLLGRELQANADILAVVPVGGPPQRLMYQGFQSLGGPLESPLCAGIAPAPANQCMGFFPIREAALFEGSFYPTRLNPLNPYLHANASREVVYHLSGPEQLQACTRSADCSGGFDRATFACVQGQCVDVHATWVAGVIGAWGDYEGATYQGVAHYRPYVSHVAGSLGVDWAVKDCDGAVRDGVCLGNQLNLLFGNSSTGYQEMRDPRSGVATLVNRAARYSYFLMAQAAGNDGDGAESFCGGLINAVCVGAYGFTSPTDRSTFGTTGEASTRNPASAPDRELPHVVGPGAGVRALNARYGIEGGVMESAQVHGTSFATPAVLSASLLAWEVAPLFGEYAYPVARKALLLQSGTTTRDGVSLSIGQLADQGDGSGAPDLKTIQRILGKPGSVQVLDLRPGDFDAQGVHSRSWPVTVRAGETLRATLVWNACGGKDLPTDLDLAISFAGTMSSCTAGLRASATHTSEYEMVEETCATRARPGESVQATITIRRKLEKPAFGCSDREPLEQAALVWETR